MNKLSTAGLMPASSHVTTRRRGLWRGGAILCIALLAGCAVEWENKQASQEIARLEKPPGSVYLGWRVFQNRCAACHGATAMGTVGGPDLLPIVRDMDARQFMRVVLGRYDWNLAGAPAASDGGAREALIDDIVQGKSYMLTMPAWEGEPSVNVHMVDLYAYLSARAQGTQGPGRPVP